MIEKKTVLVLGAGANAPYGFPTGKGLVREIWGFAGSLDSQNWCVAFNEWIDTQALKEESEWHDMGDRLKPFAEELI